jgi:NAD(P)H-hydrate epimerase
MKQNNRSQLILTNDEMRGADAFTIDELQVPSLLLMERAGAALAAEAEKLSPNGGILCVCGGGNNGGDGFVCARMLFQKGIDVEVLCVSEKFSSECAKNKAEFEKLGGTVYGVFPKKRFSLIVDCLFGTGFKGELSGKIALAADFINHSGAKVLSADIPSGVSGDTGKAAKKAVKADKTLCIGEYKAGVFLADGSDHAGEVSKIDIGIALPPKEDEESEYAFLVGKEGISELFPKRKKNTHKGTYGKVAIVAGSEKYTGAAYLSAAAALKSGAGYTYLFVPEKILPYYILKMPEIILDSINEGGRVAFIENNFEKLLSFDAVAFGMGVGVSQEVFEGAVYLLQHYEGKLLLDADALNSLAKYGIGNLHDLFMHKKCELLITPHLKEFSRLTGESLSELVDDGLLSPQTFAKAYEVTLLLKGAATIITDGTRTAINVAGTPAQAKGGSGDVLAGLCAGLCATGLSTFDSAIAGAYLCGKAAELAVEKTGEFSLTASDELAAIGSAFLSLRDK